MECAQTTWLSNKEYLQQFDRKVAQQRIPLSGSLALTHRCNLRCVHCYLGPQEAQHEKRHLEMSTEQVMSVIDEITEAGCLSLLITGGDPLLRKDFGDIYRRAKTNGLLVTVFTNGTLVTDEILELFTDLPPRAVEITLYGATVETYERITGVAGSYERCLAGIRHLLEGGVNVKLKTILMTLNRHEFFDMENMAREYGVKFRFDAAIFPRFNGDKAPLELRVPPEEAIAKDFADEDKMREWRDLFERLKGAHEFDSLYQCGAGIITFHIDPSGNLQPCLMTTSRKYNLLDGDFLTGWHKAIPHIRDKKIGTDHICCRCEKRTLCGFCPAFFELENGAEDARSEYLCVMGQLRFQAIQNITVTGG